VTDYGSSKQELSIRSPHALHIQVNPVLGARSASFTRHHIPRPEYISVPFTAPQYSEICVSQSLTHVPECLQLVVASTTSPHVMSHLICVKGTSSFFWVGTMCVPWRYSTVSISSKLSSSSSLLSSSLPVPFSVSDPCYAFLKLGSEAVFLYTNW
jgi:hypothetical protein